MSQSPAIAATVRTCESPSNFLELVKVRYKKYCDTCFRYSVAMVLARVGLHLLPSPWLTVKACNSRRANLLAVITNLLAKKKRPLLDQISDAPAPDAIRAYRRCIENSWVHNTEDRWTITELRDQLAAARLLLPAAIRTESPSSGSLGGKLPAPSTTPDATAMDAADGPTASDSDGSRAAPLGSSEGFLSIEAADGPTASSSDGSRGAAAVALLGSSESFLSTDYAYGPAASSSVRSLAAAAAALGFSEGSVSTDAADGPAASSSDGLRVAAVDALGSAESFIPSRPSTPTMVGIITDSTLIAADGSSLRTRREPTHRSPHEDRGRPKPRTAPATEYDPFVELNIDASHMSDDEEKALWKARSEQPSLNLEPSGASGGDTERHHAAHQPFADEASPSLLATTKIPPSSAVVSSPNQHSITTGSLASAMTGATPPLSQSSTASTPKTEISCVVDTNLNGENHALAEDRGPTWALFRLIREDCVTKTEAAMTVLVYSSARDGHSAFLPWRQRNTNEVRVAVAVISVDRIRVDSVSSPVRETLELLTQRIHTQRCHKISTEEVFEIVVSAPPLPSSGPQLQEPSLASSHQRLLGDHEGPGAMQIESDESTVRLFAAPPHDRWATTRVEPPMDTGSLALGESDSSGQCDGADRRSPAAGDDVCSAEPLPSPPTKEVTERRCVQLSEIGQESGVAYISAQVTRLVRFRAHRRYFEMRVTLSDASATADAEYSQAAFAQLIGRTPSEWRTLKKQESREQQRGEYSALLESLAAHLCTINGVMQISPPLGDNEVMQILTVPSADAAIANNTRPPAEYYGPTHDTRDGEALCAAAPPQQPLPVTPLPLSPRGPYDSGEIFLTSGINHPDNGHRHSLRIRISDQLLAYYRPTTGSLRRLLLLRPHTALTILRPDGKVYDAAIHEVREVRDAPPTVQIGLRLLSKKLLENCPGEAVEENSFFQITVDLHTARVSSSLNAGILHDVSTRAAHHARTIARGTLSSNLSDASASSPPHPDAAAADHGDLPASPANEGSRAPPMIQGLRGNGIRLNVDACDDIYDAIKAGTKTTHYQCIKAPFVMLFEERPYGTVREVTFRPRSPRCAEKTGNIEGISFKIDEPPYRMRIDQIDNLKDRTCMQRDIASTSSVVLESDHEVYMIRLGSRVPHTAASAPSSQLAGAAPHQQKKAITQPPALPQPTSPKRHPMPTDPLGEELTDILRTTFGHVTWRRGQLEAAKAIALGQDAMICFGTNGGKSTTWQVPALYQSTRGRKTLCVTPDVALIEDQASRHQVVRNSNPVV